jgi:o-succinylbenzoate synthase
VTIAGQLRLRQVGRRLDPPQRNANALWSERLSLELALGGNDGPTGRGEAAPLPDYSHDSVHQAERVLAALPAARLAALTEIGDARTLLDAAAELVPEQHRAARFALETALLDRAAQRAGQPLWHALAALLSHPASAPAPVALCALLPSGEPSTALALALRQLAAGVASFKLKVGPERLTSEQDATFTRLRAELGAGVQLRADANGSLSPDALRSTLEKLGAHGVEFLEEPLAGVDPALLAASPCPIALDESLQRIEPAALARWFALPELRVMVLKPTALGGLAACIRWAAVARAQGRDVLVSHTLEGPIGWAACAHLALALGGARAAGLSPLAHQLTPLPRIEHGRLVPSCEPGLGGAP